ncbi:MAG TPA: sterol carrier protein domain-containing protein, partial [Acidimicrobiia bacterium]|nr:sterol carrier protein domain-containing protein [Acidimicrobiia bacterium]
WASESSIYGRFGYGPATYRYGAKIDTRAVDPRADDVSGTVRRVEPEKASQVVRPVYERARPGRAGMLTRSDAWWTHRLMADPESWRGGKSARRYVVYEENGSVTGYAVYRQKGRWDDFMADGEVDVIEIIANTAAAHGSLWAFLSNIDLFPNLEWWNMPVDDPLPLKIADSRRISRKLVDGLWVRVMDVPAALEARTYDSDGLVTFEVEDPTRPRASGTYRLEVRDGVGQCEVVTGDGDLVLDIDVLGSLYLGGGNAMGMAAAGRIDGDAGAVRLLHRLFRTDMAPWCPEVF